MVELLLLLLAFDNRRDDFDGDDDDDCDDDGCLGTTSTPSLYAYCEQSLNRFRIVPVGYIHRAMRQPLVVVRKLLILVRFGVIVGIDLFCRIVLCCSTTNDATVVAVVVVPVVIVVVEVAFFVVLLTMIFR